MFHCRSGTHNFMQWLSVNTLFQEMMDHHNRKDGFREIQKSDSCWKLRPVVNGKHGIEIRIWFLKTTLNFGSEFHMDQINS